MKVSCGIGPLLLRLLPEGGRCPLTARLAALSVPPARTPLARCAKEYRCQAEAMTATVPGGGLSPRGEGHLPSATGSGRSAEGRDWGDVEGRTVSSTSWTDTFLHPGVRVMGGREVSWGAGRGRALWGRHPDQIKPPSKQHKEEKLVSGWQAWVRLCFFLWDRSMSLNPFIGDSKAAPLQHAPAP